MVTNSFSKKWTKKACRNRLTSLGPTKRHNLLQMVQACHGGHRLLQTLDLLPKRHLETSEGHQLGILAPEVWLEEQVCTNQNLIPLAKLKMALDQDLHATKISQFNDFFKARKNLKKVKGRLIFCAFSKKLTEKRTQIFSINSVFRKTHVKKGAKTEISGFFS